MPTTNVPRVAGSPSNNSATLTSAGSRLPWNSPSPALGNAVYASVSTA
eukprot:CAMPEP_0181387274 /NCGR_PEP_ID=MMETSP1106-20121128/23624_1 /TAXON_ID=81844 /ORGANISM="Mantoniella antarctica, Strain SL-175" /LENGTH=47 /DNA_ID= /DNA_START= /DNA_END= /DNA_ORIENTATION=